jgi:hypothetical protein
MANSKTDWARMDDSLVIPALTIRIPMPKGAAIPRREPRNETVETVAASGQSTSGEDRD